jgi:signal peptidase I
MASSPANTAPKAGDRILVHKWPYSLGGPFRPQRWDVVVFRDPADPGLHYIKRLVGMPGDRIQVKAGILHVNGEAVKRERSDFVDISLDAGRAVEGLTNSNLAVGPVDKNEDRIRLYRRTHCFECNYAFAESLRVFGLSYSAGDAGHGLHIFVCAS